MSQQRADVWAEALGRDLVTTEPAVHAAWTAIAAGSDEVRAMAGLVRYLAIELAHYRGKAAMGGCQSRPCVRPKDATDCIRG